MEPTTPTATDATPAPPHASPKRHRTWKTWQLLVAAFVGLLLGAAIGTGSSEDGDKEASRPGTTVLPTAVPETTIARPASGSSEQETVTKSASNSGSLENPVPFGQRADVEGWSVAVTRVERLGTDGLTNKPAPAGFAFVLVELDVVRVDDEPDAPISLTPNLLGASRQERSSISEPLCFGGKPHNDAVHKGGQVRTSSCISVPVGDLDAPLLVQAGLFASKWFASR